MWKASVGQKKRKEHADSRQVMKRIAMCLLLPQPVVWCNCGGNSRKSPPPPPGKEALHKESSYGFSQSRGSHELSNEHSSVRM